jgi:hypothetical protein
MQSARKVDVEKNCQGILRGEPTSRIYDWVLEGQQYRMLVGGEEHLPSSLANTILW